MPVTCALIPRFRLIAALAEPSSDGSLLDQTGRSPREHPRITPSHPLGRAAALAPEPGAAQLIGEVSEPAEGFGLRPGMRLGEALSRCPELALIPPDPERAERSWEDALQRLEGIGAEVESDRAGEAFFEASGLEGLWGGTCGVLARVRAELGPSVRLGAAPGRFCAAAAAVMRGRYARALCEGVMRGRAARRDPFSSGATRLIQERPVSCGSEEQPVLCPIVPEGGERGFLAPLPVSLLCGRLGQDEEDDLPNELERLGISTLGRLAGLPRDAVSDRFGRLGLRALRLARGQDDPLRPRPVREPIAVELELPEAVSGQQLERALELLISRLLADRARHGRTLRALRLSARLAAGGGWRRRVALRRASAEGARLADALLPHLALLPAPAATLRLEAVALGPETGEQLTLSGPEEERRQRISEAVRQTRSAAGSEAVLRVFEVDPDSRVPERREVLMPYPEGAP